MDPEQQNPDREQDPREYAKAASRTYAEKYDTPIARLADEAMGGADLGVEYLNKDGSIASIPRLEYLGTDYSENTKKLFQAGTALTDPNLSPFKSSFLQEQYGALSSETQAAAATFNPKAKLPNGMTDEEVALSVLEQERHLLDIDSKDKKNLDRVIDGLLKKGELRRLVADPNDHSPEKYRLETRRWLQVKGEIKRIHGKVSSHATIFNELFDAKGIQVEKIDPALHSFMKQIEELPKRAAERGDFEFEIPEEMKNLMNEFNRIQIDLKETGKADYSKLLEILPEREGFLNSGSEFRDLSRLQKGLKSIYNFVVNSVSENEVKKTLQELDASLDKVYESIDSLVNKSSVNLKRMSKNLNSIDPKYAHLVKAQYERSPLSHGTLEAKMREQLLLLHIAKNDNFVLSKKRMERDIEKLSGFTSKQTAQWLAESFSNFRREQDIADGYGVGGGLVGVLQGGIQSYRRDKNFTIDWDRYFGREPLVTDKKGDPLGGAAGYRPKRLSGFIWAQGITNTITLGAVGSIIGREGRSVIAEFMGKLSTHDLNCDSAGLSREQWIKVLRDYDTMNRRRNEGDALPRETREALKNPSMIVGSALRQTFFELPDESQDLVDELLQRETGKTLEELTGKSFSADTARKLQLALSTCDPHLASVVIDGIDKIDTPMLLNYYQELPEIHGVLELIFVADQAIGLDAPHTDFSRQGLEKFVSLEKRNDEAIIDRDLADKIVKQIKEMKDPRESSMSEKEGIERELRNEELITKFFNRVTDEHKVGEESARKYIITAVDEAFKKDGLDFNTWVSKNTGMDLEHIERYRNHKMNPEMIASSFAASAYTEANDLFTSGGEPNGEQVLIQSRILEDLRDQLLGDPDSSSDNPLDTVVFSKKQTAEVLKRFERIFSLSQEEAWVVPEGAAKAWEGFEDFVLGQDSVDKSERSLLYDFERLVPYTGKGGPDRDYQETHKNFFNPTPLFNGLFEREVFRKGGKIYARYPNADLYITRDIPELVNKATQQTLERIDLDGALTKQLQRDTHYIESLQNPTTEAEGRGLGVAYEEISDALSKEAPYSEIERLITGGSGDLPRERARLREMLLISRERYKNENPYAGSRESEIDLYLLKVRSSPLAYFDLTEQVVDILRDPSRGRERRMNQYLKRLFEGKTPSERELIKAGVKRSYERFYGGDISDIFKKRSQSQSDSPE